MVVKSRDPLLGRAAEQRNGQQAYSFAAPCGWESLEPDHDSFGLGVEVEHFMAHFPAPA